MITRRGLALVMFSALLTGCEETCNGPGYPSAVDHPCYYELRVTKVDKERGVVTAKVSENDVPGNADRTYYDRLYTFRVRDFDKLTATGELTDEDPQRVYEFSSAGNSLYLELFPAESMRNGDKPSWK